VAPRTVSTVAVDAALSAPAVARPGLTAEPGPESATRPEPPVGAPTVSNEHRRRWSSPHRRPLRSRCRPGFSGSRLAERSLKRTTPACRSAGTCCRFSVRSDDDPQVRPASPRVLDVVRRAGRSAMFTSS